MNFPCTHGISWGISTSVPVGQREEACFKFWYITDLTSKVMTIFSPANSIGKFLFSRWDVIGYYETCFFLPVLLRYNWHSALYKFKVYLCHISLIFSHKYFGICFSVKLSPLIWLSFLNFLCEYHSFKIRNVRSNIYSSLFILNLSSAGFICLFICMNLE